MHLPRRTNAEEGDRRSRRSGLLKSMQLMAPYTVRSELLLCELLDYNLLFLCFLHIDMVEESFVRPCSQRTAPADRA